MDANEIEMALKANQCTVVPQSFPLHAARFSGEPPFIMTKTFRPDLPMSIGAFSKVHGPGMMAWASMGRYVSIAPHAVLGGNEHPTEWLSSSAVFEAPGMHGWTNSIDEEDLRSGYNFSPSVKPISIGHDVWIADGAFIRGGVTIGNGAIVGARAVVLSDVPPYAIVAGTPAKVIRMRFSDAVIEAVEASQWWRYHFNDILQFDVRDPLTTAEGILALASKGAITPYDQPWISTDAMR